MAEKKLKFERDWYLKTTQETARKRSVLKFESERIKTADELPQLLSAKEAAESLRSKASTVADWMAKGYLESVKIRGRRFTTPQWVADFIRNEMQNG